MRAKFVFEAFTEDSDPILDMGMGMLPQYAKQLEKRWKWSWGSTPDDKDRKRIADIIKKANGDTHKEKKLAETMCKLITDPKKCYRRYLAAHNHLGLSHSVTIIFLQRAAELSGL